MNICASVVFLTYRSVNIMSFIAYILGDKFSTEDDIKGKLLLN